MADVIYLADTSVYVVQGRDPDVRRRFESLLAAGRLAACQMTALEYLNNAPDPLGHEILWAALHGHRWIDVTAAAMSRALEGPSCAGHVEPAPVLPAAEPDHRGRRRAGWSHRSAL